MYGTYVDITIFLLLGYVHSGDTTSYMYTLRNSSCYDVLAIKVVWWSGRESEN